jgi:hypothetical protein
MVDYAFWLCCVLCFFVHLYRFRKSVV